MRNGVTGAVTISDFDVAEDSLVIQATPADTVTVASQAVEAGTLVITLNTGATINLQGVTTELPGGAIVIIDPTVTPDVVVPTI